MWIITKRVLGKNWRKLWRGRFHFRKRWQRQWFRSNDRKTKKTEPWYYKDRSSATESCEFWWTMLKILSRQVGCVIWRTIEQLDTIVTFQLDSIWSVPIFKCEWISKSLAKLPRCRNSDTCMQRFPIWFQKRVSWHVKADSLHLSKQDWEVDCTTLDINMCHSCGWHPKWYEYHSTCGFEGMAIEG